MAGEDLLALIAAGPGGAVETAGPGKPIGIPESFLPYVKPYAPSGRVSPDQAERRAMGAVPRDPYYDGAEYAPRSLSPESRARLQAAMAQAGLIGENDSYRLGVWDETSSKAYKKVLAYANQGGIDADTALDELLQGAQSMAGDLESDPGRVTSTTSSLTLEAQVQAAAQARLGRKLRAGEVSKFAAIYQGMEGGFNSKVASMQDQAAASGQDASIEEIPTADVAADQYIDANFAQEEAGQSTYGYLEALRGLVGG